MEKLIILTACCFSQNPKGKGIVQHFYIFICSDCSKTSQCLLDSDSHVDVSIQFEPWGHYRRLQISLLMWRRYAVASVYCNDMTYCHSVFSLQQISFHLTPLWKQLSLSFFFFWLHSLYWQCCTVFVVNVSSNRLWCARGTLFLTYNMVEY